MLALAVDCWCYGFLCFVCMKSIHQWSLLLLLFRIISKVSIDDYIKRRFNKIIVLCFVHCIYSQCSVFSVQCSLYSMLFVPSFWCWFGNIAHCRPPLQVSKMIIIGMWNKQLKLCITFMCYNFFGKSYLIACCVQCSFIVDSRFNSHSQFTKEPKRSCQRCTYKNRTRFLLTFGDDLNMKRTIF